MRRTIYITALVAVLQVSSLTAFAQEYFEETLKEVKRATTIQEEIALLSDFQQRDPGFAAVYYHLGKRYYELIPTEHPIRDHSEFKLNIYNTRLYFGNCLHYGKDQYLKQQFYEGVIAKDKKPEYAILERYIRRKLEDVERISEASEKVYTSYYKLVNRYALCRQLFSSFSEMYKREKMAHLLLSDEDRAMLNELQIQADSLQDDIRALKVALLDYPIAGYDPQMSWMDINLYRLDGLTNTDMLQNNIPLWNYSKWVRNFLTEQEQVYAAYYAAIDAEQQTLQQTIERLRSGKPRQAAANTILLNRIERLDYGSFMKDLMDTEQRAVALLTDQYNPLFERKSKPNNAYVEEALTVLLLGAKNLNEVHRLDGEVKNKLATDETALRRYTPLLKQWNCTSKEALLAMEQEYVKMAEDAYRTACTAFAINITPTVEPFEFFVNEVSGETFGIKNLQYVPGDEVMMILPVEDKFMVVLKNGTCQICSAGGTLLKVQEHDEIGDIITAYKHGSNTIALVGHEKVLFVDKDGK